MSATLYTGSIALAVFWILLSSHGSLDEVFNWTQTTSQNFLYWLKGV